MTKKEETKRYKEQLNRWMGNLKFNVEDLMDSSLHDLEMWVKYIDKRTKGSKIILEAFNRKRAEI